MLRLRNGVVVPLLVATIVAPVAADVAVQPQPDPAKWHAYVAALKPRAGVRVRLLAGRTYEGRVLEMDDASVLIAAQRYIFGPARPERVAFADVEAITRSHRTRDLVTEVVAMGVAVLLALLAAPDFGDIPAQ